MDTIERQRRAMSAAATRRPSTQAASGIPMHCSDDAWARLSEACDAGDRVIMSLALMGVVPGADGSREAQGQSAIAARRFLAALRALIAEETAKLAGRPAGPAGADAHDPDR